MKCPTDQTELITVQRHGVEIDYCPTCRGVWLDRGELDKIIDQAVPPLMQQEPMPEAGAPPIREYREPYRNENVQEWRGPYSKPGKSQARRYSKSKSRKSFLGDLFDFD